jgi:hydroxyacylglutathione hydrolase
MRTGFWGDTYHSIEVANIRFHDVIYTMEFFRGVHVIPGLSADSNIYIIDSEIVVDSGTGEFFHSNRKDIEAEIDHKRLKLLVDTHYHYDHTGGNKKFRDWLHVPVAAHGADKEMIERGKTLAESFGQTAKVFTLNAELKEGDVINSMNFRLLVLHTPGHSAGSICLYEPEKKMLFSGDTIFENAIGRTDLPGGNYSELRYSLEKLGRYPIQYLFPGHGPPKIGGVNFLIKKMLVSMESSVII